MGNYIKIDRKILEWEWYGNINTCRLFVHMLLRANWKDGKFEGKVIPRGSFVSSIPKLSSETSLTQREIRTSIEHLKKTGEVTVKTTNRYSVFTINNYCLYQMSDTQNGSLLTDKRQSIDSLTTAIEEKKEGNKVKKEINNIICTEPNESDTVQAVITLVLNDKSLYSVCQKDIDEWTELYPAVNVIQELRKMKGWCDSNPSKRKTRRGIKRFINSWLSRQQDKGQTAGNRPVKNQFNNYQQGTSPQAISELENLFMQETNGG